MGSAIGEQPPAPARALLPRLVGRVGLVSEVVALIVSEHREDVALRVAGQIEMLGALDQTDGADADRPVHAPGRPSAAMWT